MRHRWAMRTIFRVPVLLRAGELCAHLGYREHIVAATLKAQMRRHGQQLYVLHIHQKSVPYCLPSLKHKYHPQDRY